MHIALYARAWPLDYMPNGIVTYVHCLRSALIAQGHRVSLFTELIGPGGHGPDVHPVAHGVSHRLRARLLRAVGGRTDRVFDWGVAIGNAMAKVHRRTPIDVIEIEEAFGWCADVQHRVNAPVVAKLHGPAFLTESGPSAQLPLTVARVAREGEALARMVAITSPSQCTLNAVVKRYGPLPGLLEHIPNPLQASEGLPLWNPQRCEPRTILFVGKFDWIKGGDVMVRAFARLLDRYPDAKLLFVGADDGITSVAGGKTHLAEYARDALGETRTASLTFLGRLDAARIHALRVRASMTVVASRWENQAYTALEAMAQACPTIGTNTGGMAEIIDDKVTGLLCQVDDPDDLCRAMSTLLDDPALCERLGQRAREYVLTAHSPATLARRTVSVYERLITNGLH